MKKCYPHLTQKDVCGSLSNRIQHTSLLILFSKLWCLSLKHYIKCQYKEHKMFTFNSSSSFTGSSVIPKDVSHFSLSSITCLKLQVNNLLVLLSLSIENLLHLLFLSICCLCTCMSCLPKEKKEICKEA